MNIELIENLLDWMWTDSARDDLFDAVKEREEWEKIKKLARLGALLRQQVMETREGKWGDKLSDIHPAMLGRVSASGDLSLDTASVLLDGIVRAVIDYELS